MPDPVDNAGSRIRSGASNRDLVRSAIVPVGLASSETKRSRSSRSSKPTTTQARPSPARRRAWAPVVAVLQQQPVVSVRGDDRWRFNAPLDVCAPSRRRGLANSRRRPHAAPDRPAVRPTGAAGRAEPPPDPTTSGAARTALRPSSALSLPGLARNHTKTRSAQLVTFRCCPGRLDRVLRAGAHGRLPYPIGRAHHRRGWGVGHS